MSLLTPGSYALLFPGQGAQFPGMAGRWHDKSSAVRELFDLAERQSGLPIRQLCFETDRQAQSRTDWTQPSVFVASLAGLLTFQQQLAEHGQPYRPVCVAGHSLGHFTALVAAGVLDVPSALELVCRRGRLMQAAVQQQPGGMLTILGLPLPQVSSLAERCTAGLVVLAAVNGRDQTVLAGDRDGLAEVAELARDAGASRVVPLAIGLAAHSPLMSSANEEFNHILDSVELAEPAVRIVLNTSAVATTDLDEIRQDLSQHMLRPVLWAQSVQAAVELGAAHLLDMGPGRTLSKVLLRDLAPEQVQALDQPSAEKVLFQ